MPSATLLGFCAFLAIVQALAALPWLLVVDLRTRQRLREPKTWLIGLAVCVALGVLAAMSLELRSDRGVLGVWGRVYMAILHLQLAADLLVLAFWGMLVFWSKGGAVALAAFREAVRQPMFILLVLVTAALIVFVFPVLPYFTFGEDLKMVRELCFAVTMLVAMLFGVATASISVHEEIEGRTAVTLMSKPISRRQFLLGKFAGILLSALAMTMILGWVLVWTFIVKEHFETAEEQKTLPDPAWVASLESTFEPGASADLLRGIGMWISEAGSTMPFLIIGFCQVMVMVAIAVALATRLPVVVNLPVIAIIFFLGHLTPIMTAVTQTKYALVHFVAQVFETVLPGLDLFDVGSALIRDMPLPPSQYAIYTANVTLYALIYTTIALLFGLILFEDRDLA